MNHRISGRILWFMVRGAGAVYWKSSISLLQILTCTTNLQLLYYRFSLVLQIFNFFTTEAELILPRTMNHRIVGRILWFMVRGPGPCTRNHQFLYYRFSLVLQIFNFFTTDSHLYYKSLISLLLKLNYYYPGP